MGDPDCRLVLPVIPGRYRLQVDQDDVGIHIDLTAPLKGIEYVDGSLVFAFSRSIVVETHLGSEGYPNVRLTGVPA